MTANCYNESYGIGNRNIHEGYGLSTSGSLWVWYYTERGIKQNLTYFQTEKEAVEFAFKTITADDSAKRHLVGFIKEKLKVEELLAELQNRKIHFYKDEIPYGGLVDRRIRVFVFGCDINRVSDLQQQFSQIQ
ncbi:MAG: hypothetical protein ABIN01_25290 [Ferruginibacter sp.]